MAAARRLKVLNMLKQTDATKVASPKSIDGNNEHVFDDWPKPPQSAEIDETDVTMGNIHRWRLQMLLAVNPWGIPSLAFGESYKRMFGHVLDVRELGFEHLSEMVDKLDDVFAVQEPDETTGILFPDYASDRILHDARLGHDFNNPDFDSELGSSICSTTVAKPMARGGHFHASHFPGAVSLGSATTKQDYEELLHRAWLNRDEDFPPDVVLAGEPYDDLLIYSTAMLPNTRGLYQATLLSAASPKSLYVRLKTTPQEEKRLLDLPDAIENYFKESCHPIDCYNVPPEFLYPGFPCIVYMTKDEVGTYERCVIAAKSTKPKRVLVEAVDYGTFYLVDQLFLYLIPRKFLDLPRQTLQVSLAGIKPNPEPGETKSAAEQWRSRTGSRLRCFSYSDYWLDIVLMDKVSNSDHLDDSCSNAEKDCLEVANKTLADDSSQPVVSAANSKTKSSENDAATAAKRADKMSRRYKAEPRFDALIVDRNDDDMDLFLDEMLLLETYAVEDEARKKRHRED